MLAGAVIAGSLITALAIWSVTRPIPLRVARLAITTAPLYITLTLPDVAISPDGTRVVYKAGAPPNAYSPLAVRSLDQLSAISIEGRRSFNPFVSPNSSWVGFYESGTLKRVSVLGGPSTTICPTPAGAVIRGASWAEDDTIVFGTMAASGLWLVSADGGEADELTHPDAATPDQNHIWPEILPGGRAVLFTIVAGAVTNAQIAVLNLDTGEQSVLVPGGSYPRYSPSGHLVYGTSGGLYAVGFDLDRLAVTSTPVRVLDGVVTKSSGAASFSFSEDGTLVYVPGGEGEGEPGRLIWVNRDGTQAPLEGLESGRYESVSISPDGTQIAIAITSGAANAADVWAYDRETATLSPLTNDLGASARSPVWTPDGEHIVFGSNREGPWGLFVTKADGTGEVERLMTDDNALRLLPRAWSSDGTFLALLKFMWVRNWLKGLQEAQ